MTMQHGRQAFDEYIAANGRAGDGRDLLGKLIYGDDKSEPLLDQEIVFEVTNLIFAGTDTTSNTLSYMFYELAKLPVWQDRLQDELDQQGAESILAHSQITSLPILEAIIHETLRFHPAAPASLQRLSPHNEAIIIDGVVIPPNVSE